MCIEDLKLDRNQSYNISRVVIVNATASLVLPKSVRRVGMLIAGDGAAIHFVGPESAPPLAAAGIPIPIARGFVILRIEDIGTILYEGWSIFNNGAAPVTFTVIEIIQNLDTKPIE